MPSGSRRVSIKVCLVGDSEVGKTAVLHRFVSGIFDDRYIPTIGAKIATKELPIRRGDKPLVASLSIWDMMGVEGFRELLKDAYFHGAQGVVAVCDVTNPDTLRDLELWFRCVVEIAGRVPTYVLCNKADLAGARIDEGELKDFCEVLRIPHAFGSAKTGSGVSEAFEWVVEASLSPSKSPEHFATA